MAQQALQPKQYRAQPLAQEEVAYIGDASGRNGFLAAVAAGVASSGIVYGANTFSPIFRRSLGISGKAALVVTPTAGAFFLQSHLTVAAARADPDAFVAGKPATAKQSVQPQHDLALWQRAANWVYFNPMKCIFGIALPAYAKVFHIESTSPATASMPLSQRIIHTRVCECAPRANRVGGDACERTRA